VKSDEVWKDVNGYEGLYQVSSHGNVRSLLRKNTGIKRYLRFNILRNGYKNVTLFKKEKRKGFLVHRLVAQAFINNSKNKPHINHIDFNTGNNCVENLEWVTNKENWLHNVKERKIKLKLSDQDAFEIKECYKTGLFSTRYLSKCYGVSQKQICKIINNKIQSYNYRTAESRSGRGL